MRAARRLRDKQKTDRGPPRSGSARRDRAPTNRRAAWREAKRRLVNKDQPIVDLARRADSVAAQEGSSYAEFGLTEPGPGDRVLAWSVDLTGVAAPPVDPFIWTEPNAFIQVQAVSAGLTPPGREWPDRQSAVVFRREFDVR